MGPLALCTCALAPRPALGEADVLERPAAATAHATSAVLLSVTTRAPGRLVAAGERGIILTSEDDGVTWAQAVVPVSVSLTRVQFPTPRKGWAVGHSGVVLHTEDGGRTWSRQLDGRQAARLVLAAARAGPAGPETARRVALGERLVAEGPDKPFLGVYFADELRGFVVGAYGLFLVTRDGGRTWLPWQDHLANPEGRHLYCVQPVGPYLYVSGEQGTLYRSADGGGSFVRLATPYAGTYFGVLPAPGDRAPAGVVVFGLRGHAYWSADGGQDFRESRLGATASVSAGLVLADGSVVLATAAGDVLRSADGGRSFERLRVARPFPFTSLAQAADGSLVLCGARGLARVPLPTGGPPT